MTKINAQQWQQILGAIASGLTNDDACLSAGVGRSVFYEKKKNDLDFADNCKKAEIQFKLTHVQKIAKDSSWQASAWLLERKFKGEFGKLDNINVNFDPIRDIKIDIKRADSKPE